MVNKMSLIYFEKRNSFTKFLLDDFIYLFIFLKLILKKQIFAQILNIFNDEFWYLNF